MKSTSLLVVLFMVAFGGFIGFDRSSNSTVNATEPIVLQSPLPAPKLDPLSLVIDLKKEQVHIDKAQESRVNVRIEKELIEVPKYITIKKNIYVEDSVKMNKLFNKVLPLKAAKVSFVKSDNHYNPKKIWQTDRGMLFGNSK